VREELARGVLHVVGAAVQQGVEGEGGPFGQVQALGAPGHGLRGDAAAVGTRERHSRRAALGGVQTDGNGLLAVGERSKETVRFGSGQTRGHEVGKGLRERHIGRVFMFVKGFFAYNLHKIRANLLQFQIFCVFLRVNSEK
jgi:hypothetical protein